MWISLINRAWTWKKSNSGTIPTTPSTPVNEAISGPHAKYYVVKGSRFLQEHFEKFLPALTTKTGLNFEKADYDPKSKTIQDPGAGHHVIVIDYWGRPGGDLSRENPIPKYKELKASFSYVIVRPDLNMDASKMQEPCPIILTYNHDLSYSIVPCKIKETDSLLSALKVKKTA